MGKKSTKTSSTTSIPKWAQGYAEQGAGTIMDTVQGNQGNLNNIAAGIRGQLPHLGQMAFGPNPGLDAANGYAMDTLGGKYLNGNPQTEAMVRMGEQDAGNAVNSAFSMAGRTGGGNHAERLAQGVANAGNTIRFGQYNQERAHQDTAAGMLPALSAARFAGVPAYLGAAQAAAQTPYAGLGPLASMGSLWSGQGTTSQTQPGGWGTQLLGAAASALPFILSDRRLKADIERIGEWDDKGDGLGRYRYRYIFDPSNTMVEGVMADEVKELRPQAYVPNFRGEYAGVNYAALGVAA